MSHQALSAKESTDWPTCQRQQSRRSARPCVATSDAGAVALRLVRAQAQLIDECDRTEQATGFRSGGGVEGDLTPITWGSGAPPLGPMAEAAICEPSPKPSCSPIAGRTPNCAGSTICLGRAPVVTAFPHWVAGDWMSPGRGLQAAGLRSRSRHRDRGWRRRRSPADSLRDGFSLKRDADHRRGIAESAYAERFPAPEALDVGRAVAADPNGTHE